MKTFKQWLKESDDYGYDWQNDPAHVLSNKGVDHRATDGTQTTIQSNKSNITTVHTAVIRFEQEIAKFKQQLARLQQELETLKQS